jgi:hypothetical protein
MTVTDKAFEIMKPFCTAESTAELWELNHSKVDRGWISPDGIFYPCGYWEHDDLIEELLGLTPMQHAMANSAATKDWFWVKSVCPSQWDDYYMPDAVSAVLHDIAMSKGFEKELQAFQKEKDEFFYNVEHIAIVEPPELGRQI